VQLDVDVFVFVQELHAGYTRRANGAAIPPPSVSSLTPLTPPHASRRLTPHAASRRLTPPHAASRRLTPPHAASRRRYDSASSIFPSISWRNALSSCVESARYTKSAWRGIRGPCNSIEWQRRPDLHSLYLYLYLFCSCLCSCSSAHSHAHARPVPLTRTLVLVLTPRPRPRSRSRQLARSLTLSFGSNWSPSTIACRASSSLLRPTNARAFLVTVSTTNRGRMSDGEACRRDMTCYRLTGSDPLPMGV
jgi:hypothetical protein